MAFDGERLRSEIVALRNDIVYKNKRTAGGCQSTQGGSDFENDEILYISGRQARVIRLGLTSTTFFMTDRATKMLVPNSQLKALVIEKKLPVNGGQEYLPKGNEKGVMKVEVVNEEV